MGERLKPLEAAIRIRVGLIEAGIETPEEQADAMIAVLRARFSKATRADDQLVAETLRVFGCSESRIWELARAWCEELGRDEGEVFENVWAPGFEKDKED